MQQLEDSEEKSYFSRFFLNMTPMLELKPLLLSNFYVKNQTNPMWRLEDIWEKA